jgi:tRNA(Ile2) C34 agmatinyltransferase TiaS
VPERQRPPVAPERWYRDGLGITLAAAGVAALATGATLIVVAYRKAEAADAASMFGDFERARSRAYTFQTAGWITTGGGVALLAGAALRLTLRDRTATAVSVSALPLPGAGLAIEGRF